MSHSIIKEYFTFSKSQSKGALALSVLLCLAGGIYFSLPYWAVKNVLPVQDDIKKLELQIIEHEKSAKTYQNGYEKRPIAKLTPFSFDPNLLSEQGFLKLGLPQKLVSTIMNFRNKGGKFYNKESLRRIYGLQEEEFKQLELYISIPNTYTNSFSKKEKPKLDIELNTADTTQLVALRGVGSKIAQNIVIQRDLLGGYVSIDQLKQVYGISEETFSLIKPSIRVNSKLVKRINLNTATFYEINLHPYLKGEIAKAIIEYRKNHDYKIDNLNQLKEISLINEEIFRKIVPYLSL